MWIHVNYMYEKNNFPSPLQLNRICYAHFLLKCEIIINLSGENSSKIIFAYRS